MAASKYKAKKVTLDGYTFASKDESLYYQYLLLQKQKGEIINFELQPKYELQGSFKKYGKSYRPITYAPDYLIYHLDGSLELIDVKSLGSATQQGELRRKMFDYKYPDLKLTWICRSRLHGNEAGWVEYEKLKSIYAKSKKEKVKEEC